MKIKKISKNIIPIIVISVIGFSLILAMISAYVNESRRAVDKVSTVYMEELSEQISIYFETNIENYYQKMETIAHSITEKELENVANLQEYLESVQEVNKFYELALVDRNGQALSYDKEYPMLTKVTDLPLLLNKTVTRLISFNETVWDSELLIFGISMNSKMIGDHEIVALIIGVELEDIKKTILISEEQMNSYTNIVKRDGSFVIRNDANTRYEYGFNILVTLRQRAIFKDRYSIDTLEDDIKMGKSNLTSFYIDGSHEYIYYTPIDGTEFYVFMGMPYATINNQITELTTLIIVIGVIIILVIIAIIIYAFSQYHKHEKIYRDKLIIERNKAEQANKYKNNFLSQISHEIRTPMNGIIGMTKIGLLSIGKPSKVRSCFEKISLSSNHLLLLINDILDISKIESGQTVIYNEPFEINSIIQTVINSFYPLISKKKITFEVIIANDVEEYLIGDSLRLNQIINNLLSNALKFTNEKGKITFELTKEETTEEQTWISFKISDTGIGIKEEDIDKIFTSFVQADSGVYKKFGGTGLGLPIVKHYAEMMGGNVFVESKFNVGTTFTVKIPFAYETKENIKEDVFINKKILTVHMNPKVNEHLTMLLERIGFTVFKALDLEEAKKVINNEQIDYCLIDNEYKSIKDFIKNIRKTEQKTKFILTGYDKVEIEEIKNRVQADDTLLRPLATSDLIKAFKHIIAEEKAYNEVVIEKLFADQKILVAEDNKLNLEIIVELLRMNGAYVDVAEDGTQAIDLFVEKENYYDLILMDIQMPNLDGYEATKIIRTSNRADAGKVIIVAMTANAFPDDVKKCLEAGMNAHISKPFELKHVYDVYQELLEKRNNGQSN